MATIFWKMPTATAYMAAITTNSSWAVPVCPSSISVFRHTLNGRASTSQ